MSVRGPEFPNELDRMRVLSSGLLAERPICQRHPCPGHKGSHKFHTARYGIEVTIEWDT
jgi:hypothetical protein